MLSSKLWFVRICIAFSVLVMFNLSTRVLDWWIRIATFEYSMHWELIFPFNFIILGIIPIVYLVLFVGVGAGYWSSRFLLFLIGSTSYFGAIISSIWLGAAVGKAFYICE